MNDKKAERYPEGIIPVITEAIKGDLYHALDTSVDNMRLLPDEQERLRAFIEGMNPNEVRFLVSACAASFNMRRSGRLAL